EAEEKGWFRRKLFFKNITCNDLLDFPEMTETDMKIFFTGSYQLSQAVSYLVEMVDKNSKLNIEYVKDEKNVLKLKVPSRHISRATYRCFLRYKPNISVSDMTHYACECANGRRTIDCCSHIAAIYHLSYARYYAAQARTNTLASRGPRARSARTQPRRRAASTELAKRASSPDLNSIENVWAHMQSSWISDQLRTREALRNHVHQVWNQLSLQPNYTENLINSMRRRLQLVINNDGYWMPY
ncbi:hypothetical protein ALC57_17644, partial [Trachymyrmex cornetzi]